MKRISFRMLAAAVAGAIVIAGAAAQAPKAEVPPAETKKPEEIRKDQEQNAKLFKEVSRKILELAVKLDKSDKPEDKDRAKTLRAALEVAEKAGAENQFRALLGGMRGDASKPQDLERLIGQDQELAKTIKEMLDILNTDDESARIRAEIIKLEKFIKEAEDIKRRQELLRTLTENKKGDPSKIGKNQNDLANQTKDLAGRMGGAKGEGKKTEQAISKADPKATEPKDGEKASEPKSDTQGSKSEGKDGEAKPGAGSEAKPNKAGPPKDGEAKPADPKEGKDGEAKPAEPKDPMAEAPKAEQSASKGQGEGKGEGKPSKGQGGEGKGKGGSPPKDQQASSKSGGSSGGGGASPPPPPPPQNQVPGRKSVEEAYPKQKGAEEDINKEKREEASKKQDKAIEDLAKAIEEMKKRLKQLREEELMKLLANLEARCNRMLGMQIEVYQNTKGIHEGIVKNDNQKTNADIQKSQVQSSKEKDIIAEAERTLKLLETEGSAVAFALVLEEVMGDMHAVQLRLENGVVDPDTQGIEENIIAMLKDMILALKKKQQEMQNNKNNPPPGQSKPNQKLIDQLAELKLIRAMQSQVNNRTTMYGKKSDGEQAIDALVQGELKQLATRQTKLQDMIQKIATQANQ